MACTMVERSTARQTMCRRPHPFSRQIRPILWRLWLEWRYPPFMAALLLHAEMTGCRIGAPLSTTARALLPLLHASFASLYHERLVVAGLDEGLRLKAYEERDGGTDQLAGAMPLVRQMLGRLSIRILVMAHNHPCGSLRPSATDIETTRTIAAFARLGRVQLDDHLIFASGSVVSFRRLGLL